MTQSNNRKRPRGSHNHYHHHLPSSSRAASSTALIESITDKTVTENSQKIRRTSSQPVLPFSPSPSATENSTVPKFNDPSTADVSLLLEVDSSTPFTDTADSFSPAEESDFLVYLHSAVIRRADYFSAVLSDRWQQNKQSSDNENSNNLISLKLKVPPTPRGIFSHLIVIELLYTNDFSGVINSVAAALDILPVALKLLFEDCVKSCVRFLEAVPWSEEEEERVISLVPLLDSEISKELLSRVRPDREGSCEEMLHGLIVAAINNNPNMAFVKAFVAKLLRDFSSRESARVVLERTFGETLKTVKESVENYLSPDFRGDHNETEALQRLNLHAAVMNGRHLLWLVERMIELREADSAVKEWSEMGSFTADLQRVFREDVWRNISPGLPAIMLRCTCRIANAVASGNILAARQVRMKLVKHWLPILIVCKENISSLLPSNKSLCIELEETFLRIISTLPMSDAQVLLQQCVSFSTRNVDDCPHLVMAFNTWFRRATRVPQVNKP